MPILKVSLTNLESWSSVSNRAMRISYTFFVFSQQCIQFLEKYFLELQLNHLIIFPILTDEIGTYISFISSGGIFPTTIIYSSMLTSYLKSVLIFSYKNRFKFDSCNSHLVISSGWLPKIFLLHISYFHKT